MSLLALRLHHALPTLLLATSTVACGPLLLDPDEVEFRETIGCASCPPNSPHVNDAPIPNLRLSGLPNDDGVSLLGLRPNTSAPLHTVTTDSHEDLVAVLDGTIVASGAGLVGWQLVVEFEGEEEVVTIAGYDPAVPSLADAGRPITTYALNFSVPAGSGAARDVNVCPGGYASGDTVITVIRGETYDNELKKVHYQDPDWVTLACADEAAYKTKRLGYGPMSALGPPNPAASKDQRDATLKMITADYCGTGESFTAQGTGLYYEDRAGIVVAYTHNVQLTEALWTKDGALCLDFPRHTDREKVSEVCDLPYCGALDHYQAGIVWQTGVPPY
ncbi:MAG: hypothetical protein JNL82_06580 [Myxococcales bacterium]|nr:hypothetical protein [Myxococcales bacterium]